MDYDEAVTGDDMLYQRAWLIFFIHLKLALFAASSVSADNWVIGVDADLSNRAKEGGQAILRGVELAVEEINEQGGLLGKPVEIDARDHRGNPARGITNIESLAVNENLLAVVGGVHTPVSIAELGVIHQRQVIYLDPWAAGTPVVDNGFNPNLVFRVSVRDEWAGPVILAQAKEDGCPSVSLLLERTGWGRSNERSMKAAAESLALPISFIDWFNWGDSSLNKMVADIAERNEKCLVVVANTPEGAGIVRAAASLDEAVRPAIYSHWGILGGDFVSQVGLAALNEVDLHLLQTIVFSEPKTQQGELLYQRFIERYGEPVGYNSFNGVAHAYDLVHMLAIAVTKAGSGETEQVRQQLKSLESYAGVMKAYRYPFSGLQEGLTKDDYLMVRFNRLGFIGDE